MRRGVRVRFEGPDVLLGDYKSGRFGDREPIIRLSSRQWTLVVDALWPVRAGARGVSLTCAGALSIVIEGDGHTTMTGLTTGTELFFDAGEIDAFLDAVHADALNAAPVAPWPRRPPHRTAVGGRSR